MRTVADIVSELSGIKFSISKRISAGGSAETSHLLQAKLALQVARGIGNLAALDADGSALLFEAIGAADLEASCTQSLTDAVDKKLLEAVEEPPDDAANTQKLKNPEEWMKEGLYKLFIDPKKSFHLKLQADNRRLARNCWNF